MGGEGNLTNWEKCFFFTATTGRRMEHIITKIPGHRRGPSVHYQAGEKCCACFAALARECEFCVVSGTDHDIDAIASAMWFRRCDWLLTTRLGPSASSVDKHRRQITMGITSTWHLMGPKLFIILGQPLLGHGRAFSTLPLHPPHAVDAAHDLHAPFGLLEITALFAWACVSGMISSRRACRGLPYPPSNVAIAGH